jgi:hypothetical protein
MPPCPRFKFEVFLDVDRLKFPDEVDGREKLLPLDLAPLDLAPLDLE